MDATDWNEFAADYYKAQRASQLCYPYQLITTLHQRGLVRPHDHVIDVGSGSGRFALPLSLLGCQVQLIDFSKVMLAYARQLLSPYQVKATYCCTTWQEYFRQQPLRRTDTVFAAMVPGLTVAEVLDWVPSCRGVVVCGLTGSYDSVFSPWEEQGVLEPARPELKASWFDELKQRLKQTHFFSCQGTFTQIVPEILTLTEWQDYIEMTQLKQPPTQFWTHLKEHTDQWQRLTVDQHYQINWTYVANQNFQRRNINDY